MAQAQAFQPEQHVTWVWTPRGGYGYTQRIPVRIVKVHPRSATIAVPLERGGFALRVVRLTSLEA